MASFPVIVFLLREEVVNRLFVYLGKFHKLHYVDTAVSAFAFGHKVWRSAHHCGYLVLRQTCLFARRDQALDKGVIGPLKLSRSRFS